MPNSMKLVKGGSEILYGAYKHFSSLKLHFYDSCWF